MISLWKNFKPFVKYSLANMILLAIFCYFHDTLGIWAQRRNIRNKQNVQKLHLPLSKISTQQTKHDTNIFIFEISWEAYNWMM
jgi:hypothetical protein